MVGVQRCAGESLRVSSEVMETPKPHHPLQHLASPSKFVVGGISAMHGSLPNASFQETPALVTKRGRHSG